MARRIEGGGSDSSTRRAGGGSFGSTPKPPTPPKSFGSTSAKPPAPAMNYLAPQKHSFGTTAAAPQHSMGTSPQYQPQSGSFADPGAMAGGAVGTGAPVDPTPISEEDYLKGDAGYQTQYSALTSALQRYLADTEFQKTNYNTDYDRSLRDLGYNEAGKSWNWDDTLTASGRGYQNQLNDFASRGMLQSQGYADAFSELQRMLGQQYDSVSGAKTSFMTDLDNQTANYKGENTSAMQAARAEALQRRAAQYSLG